MVRLGIDYGTTNTVVVSCDRGRYPVVPHLAETSVGLVARETFPSLVVYDRKRDRFLFGADAERSLYLPGAAERFGVIPSLKRLLRDYAEGHRVGHDMVPGGLEVREVLTALARAVMVSVRKSGFFGEDEPLPSVLTWPANANGAQRYVTRHCFKEAGFDILSGLNEPSAAAIELADRLARGNRVKARQLSTSVAVFDLGGGTFDVSLVKIAGGEFTVLGAAGIEQLGGDDFDMVLAGLFARKWSVELPAMRPFQRLLLLTQARQQKESISSGTVRSLSLSPKDLGLKGRVASVPVASYFKELRRLLEPAVNKLVELVDGAAARQAGIRRQTLDAIYLVGGSSKLPLVPEMVAAHFPNTRLIVSDKPFSSTAMGAAIHAAEEVRLHDILSRNFGVIRLADHGRTEYFAPIFPAGMRLPKPGDGPRRQSVDYGPQHNIGHLRYLECTAVNASGQPAEGVRYWSDAVFPYDPAIPVTGGLSPQAIEYRPDLSDQAVQETYFCDADGVITVQILRRCDGQSLCCEIFRG